MMYIAVVEQVHGSRYVLLSNPEKVSVRRLVQVSTTLSGRLDVHGYRMGTGSLSDSPCPESTLTTAPEPHQARKCRTVGGHTHD